MTQPEINADVIMKHLKSRPIAAIVDQCKEKNCLKALKLLCILDYHAEIEDLYSRIESCSDPKFLSQLFQFYNLGTFRFYKFDVHHQVSDLVFKCKFCGLTGPYKCILTHMAINHNSHTAVKTCTFCKTKKLAEHLQGKSLNQCYEYYKKRCRILDDKNRDDIVTDFYDMLKTVSRKLGIVTERSLEFSGGSYKSNDRLRKTKSVENTNINKEFEEVISSSIWLVETEMKPEHLGVIVVDNSDDETERDTTSNGIGLTMQTTQSKESSLEKNGQCSSTANQTTITGPGIKEERLSIDLASNHSTLGMEDRNSNSPSANALNTEGTVEFGLYVAQRLAKLPDDLKRRKLEIAIQEVIVKAEKEALE